jgi:hypothetical protein
VGRPTTPLALTPGWECLLLTGPAAEGSPDPGRTGGETIHVFTDPADLPDPAELGPRSSSGPVVYWVLDENWFVATEGRTSALEIGRLLRGDVYAPGEELLLSGERA